MVRNQRYLHSCRKWRYLAGRVSLHRATEGHRRPRTPLRAEPAELGPQRINYPSKNNKIGGDQRCRRDDRARDSGTNAVSIAPFAAGSEGQITYSISKGTVRSGFWDDHSRPTHPIVSPMPARTALGKRNQRR